MESVRVSFPSDMEGMLRSEIWNYKTDPPHNGAGLVLHSLYNPFHFCLYPLAKIHNKYL